MLDDIKCPECKGRLIHRGHAPFSDTPQVFFTCIECGRGYNGTLAISSDDNYNSKLRKALIAKQTLDMV
jgi:hypothetical protein